jgi:hypothetical protein
MAQKKHFDESRYMYLSSPYMAHFFMGLAHFLQQAGQQFDPCRLCHESESMYFDRLTSCKPWASPQALAVQSAHSKIAGSEPGALPEGSKAKARRCGHIHAEKQCRADISCKQAIQVR